MTTETPLDLTPVSPTPTKRSRRTWVILFLLVGVIGVMLSQGMLQSLNYFKTVGEVYQDRTSVGTREVRLEGMVVKGTVERTSQGATFTIRGAKTELVTVTAVGTPPQLFRAGIPVVVVGSFTSPTSYSFHANQIMVKHSAEYIQKNPGRVKGSDGMVQ
ncbi:MAG: cytochrome c maturation protein CcmE [Actinomycetes bacterium]